MNVSKRCLRSKSGDDQKVSTNGSNVSTRLRIAKEVANDGKLFATQTVSLSRLAPNVIKRYDKVFYQKFSKQIKTLYSYNKYIEIHKTLANSKPPPVQGLNDSPKRMLLWSNSNQLRQQINYPLLRSQTNRWQQLIQCDERENSLMTSSQYCRYLDLILTKDYNHMNSRQLKTSFCLRNISKCEDFVTNDSKNLLLNSEFLLHNLVINSVKSRVPPELIGCLDGDQRVRRRNIKRRLWTSKTVNKIKEKYMNIEKQKRKFAEQWKQQYLQCLTAYPLSSPMGQRVQNSLNCQQLEEMTNESLVQKADVFCKTNIRFRIRSEDKNKFNKWKSRDIERLTTSLELTQSDRQLNSHQYSFTRRQRFDRQRRLETGIAWKSRLLALSCDQKAKIRVNRVKRCSICGQTIDFNHSCDLRSFCSTNKFDSNEKPNTSRITPKTDDKRNAKHLLKVMSNKSNAKKETMDQNMHRICRINLDEEHKRIVNIDLDENGQQSRRTRYSTNSFPFSLSLRTHNS